MAKINNKRKEVLIDFMSSNYDNMKDSRNEMEKN